MARGGQPADATNWALAKRFYRFVANERRIRPKAPEDCAP
jgi:hypothetical protein